MGTAAVTATATEEAVTAAAAGTAAVSTAAAMASATAAVAFAKSRLRRYRSRLKFAVDNNRFCPSRCSAAPRVREAAGHRLDAPPHVLDAGDPPFSFFLLLSAALALVAYAVGWRPG